MFTHELDPFQMYFTLFFLLGLNPHVSFTNQPKKLSKLLTMIPRLVAILCNIYIAYRDCENISFDKIANIFGRVVLIIGAIANLTAIFENLYNAQNSHQILSEISTVINILKMYLNIEYSYKLAKKTLNRKLVLLITVIVLGSTIKYYIEATNGINRTFSILWAISTFFKYIHLFHLSFYIEFLRFTMKSLNEKLTNKVNNSQAYWYHGQKNKLWHDLHYMKTVYLRLLNVAHEVNSLFGWFLVICMLETSSTAVFNAYWEFDLLAHAAFKQILRKYRFIFHSHFICRIEFKNENFIFYKDSVKK